MRLDDALYDADSHRCQGALSPDIWFADARVILPATMASHRSGKPHGMMPGGRRYYLVTITTADFFRLVS